jgi:hypothetical protein
MVPCVHAIYSKKKKEKKNQQKRSIKEAKGICKNKKQQQQRSQFFKFSFSFSFAISLSPSFILPLQPASGAVLLAQQIPTLSLLEGVFLNSCLQPKLPHVDTEHR